MRCNAIGKRLHPGIIDEAISLNIETKLTFVLEWGNRLKGSREMKVLLRIILLREVVLLSFLRLEQSNFLLISPKRSAFFSFSFFTLDDYTKIFYHEKSKGEIFPSHKSVIREKFREVCSLLLPKKKGRDR